ncbi:YceI family protein [Flagellimonas allohymeniacidonis]|uniref:Polyisoprenoid-binding protein n=1 Tax=Flagellimonas allohymeniacidonis TaxID=2517819 RepID=A0A4V2HSQ1_9FLAO|nr:YceI family protein [Allomuricauda hymeniacidonis]TAI48530.1 polyisoprenoid-binding protein [Allomuricauda hymeniacidonis]
MKTFSAAILVGLAFLFSPSNTLQAQKYTIDSGHSNIQIKVERFGVVDVVGRFKDVSGTIVYDAQDVMKTGAEATIKVESYDANNPGGEAAVKSQAFLHAEKYPEIRFLGKSISAKDGENFLVGDLTIHGTTQEIELPFSIKGPLLDLPSKKQSIAFNGSIVINRQDYGVSFDRKLPNGTLLVGNEVEITLNVLALEE